MRKTVLSEEDIGDIVEEDDSKPSIGRVVYSVNKMNKNSGKFMQASLNIRQGQNKNIMNRDSNITMDNQEFNYGR